jgi:hypothetical protein
MTEHEMVVWTVIAAGALFLLWVATLDEPRF